MKHRGNLLCGVNPPLFLFTMNLIIGSEVYSSIMDHFTESQHTVHTGRPIKIADRDVFTCGRFGRCSYTEEGEIT